MPSRFKLLTLAELAAQPMPQVLIPGALRTSDIAVLIDRNGGFSANLARILGSRARCLDMGPSNLPGRAVMMRRLQALRSDGLAVVLVFAKPDEGCSWWASEADATLHAESPTRASLMKCRHADDHNKIVVLDADGARVMERPAP